MKTETTITMPIKEWEELQDYKRRFLKTRIHDTNLALSVTLMKSRQHLASINSELKSYGLEVRGSFDTASVLPIVTVERI